jgi:Phosphatidylinositol kinase and protein kinases of the PI-3 kinase family
MADAMGRGGGEGGFLYSCTITNRVLRLHKEQLLSVLKPFLYDPLVNWQGRGFKGNENAEMTNSEVSF